MTGDRELLDFDARQLDYKIAQVIHEETWNALMRIQDDEEDNECDFCDVCGQDIPLGEEERCYKAGEYYQSLLCPDCYAEFAC